MLSYFPAGEYGTRSNLDAMTRDAEAGSGGLSKYQRTSNYHKGANLVDCASLAIWDQDRMLGKIYGAQNVAGWDNDKRHSTYRHLIGREYAAMMAEREKKKAAKKATPKKKAIRKTAKRR